MNGLSQIDVLLIIPDNIPPHKEALGLVSGEDRMRMCEIAFSHLEKANISDLELKRQGPSYTVDTLRELSEKYDKLYLACGGDMIETFHLWRNYEEILRLAEIIAFSRDGKADGDFKKGIDNILSKGGRVTVADCAIPSLSSSEIRYSIDKSRNFLPLGVWNYIVEKGLYK